jgi:hypothetical protein
MGHITHHKKNPFRPTAVLFIVYLGGVSLTLVCNVNMAFFCNHSHCKRERKKMEDGEETKKRLQMKGGKITLYTHLPHINPTPRVTEFHSPLSHGKRYLFERFKRKRERESIYLIRWQTNVIITEGELAIEERSGRMSNGSRWFRLTAAHD